MIIKSQPMLIIVQECS